MNPHRFELLPHPTGKRLADLCITGHVQRRNHVLSIAFALHDPGKAVLVEPQVANPNRRYGLWEQTCFEIFIAAANSTEYWEINLSPAGHWNVFRFDAYRLAMREETAYLDLPMSVMTAAETLTLTCDMDLHSIITPSASMIMGISAVLKTKADGMSYWALRHPGARPDFHHRDGFVLELQ